MSEELFIRDVNFLEVERKIKSLLNEIDSGLFDEELDSINKSRNPNVTLSDKLAVSREQNLSPDEWGRVIVTFSPVAATIATSIWTIIIVPKLKKAFREDSISEKNPDQSAKK